jgi:arsenate reductase
MKTKAMKKIYHLSSCNTCQRILKSVPSDPEILLQDIKSEPIGAEELEQLRQLAGSYEALFSKRARLYRERGLKDQDLGEEDFRELLLEHYTFLKRPVIVVGERIFIGNAKKTVAEAAKALDA